MSGTRDLNTDLSNDDDIDAYQANSHSHSATGHANFFEIDDSDYNYSTDEDRLLASSCELELPTVEEDFILVPPLLEQAEEKPSPCELEGEIEPFELLPKSDKNTDLLYTNWAQNSLSIQQHTQKIRILKVQTYTDCAVVYFKRGGLIMVACVPPMSFAVNAFCAYLHITPAQLSCEKLAEYSKWLLVACGVNAASSYSINLLLNRNTFEKAFAMITDRIYNNFSKHPTKNTIALVLALCSGVASASIGYAAFLPLGKELAWLNFFTNGGTAFLTRFYGIGNAMNRFEKWYSHRFTEHPFANDSFQHLLSHLTDECANQLERFLQIRKQKGEIDEAIMVALLKKINILRKNDPSIIRDSTNMENLGCLFDLIIAVGAGLAVLPIFAQKFLDGLDKLKGLCTNETDSTTFADLTIWLKGFLSIFSIATSILYAGQTSLFRQTMINAKENIMAPGQTSLQKTGKWVGGAALAVANGFAATALYNVAEGAINEPSYIAKDLTPPGSTSAILAKISAAAYVFLVNGKLVAEEVFKAPKKSTHPTVSYVKSVASVPRLARQSSEESLLPAIEENQLNEYKEESKHEPEVEDDYFDVSQEILPRANQQPLLNNALAWLNSNTLSRASLNELHSHNPLDKAPPTETTYLLENTSNRNG